MRAVCYREPGGAPRIGRLEDTTIVDAGPAGPARFIPTPDAWAALEQADGPRVSLQAVDLLHPVVPGKLICIGLNYRDHAVEAGLGIPTEPVIFAKFTSALVGPDEAIMIAPEDPATDYEAEMAIVIGRRVRRASATEARSAIGGVTALNDVSARSAQLNAPAGQFTRGKSFDTFAPLGPAIADARSLDLGALRVRCLLNGEVMQDSTTDQLIFDAIELVRYCSATMTLEPGDILATGTPGGVGHTRVPPRYLSDGDVVEVVIDGVGVLRNPVRAELPPVAR